MKNGKRFGKIITAILSALLSCFLLPKANASYMVEGTPTQKAVSDTVESTEPVCYIGSTFYTSIEGALTAAGNNTGADTVYVIPGVTTTISKDCTIANNDSLVLPYSATLDESNNTYSEETYTNGDNYNSTNAFADASANNVSTYRKSLVYIDDGVTLTVNGTLTIGGQTGRTNSGVSGNTNGDYCEMNLGKDSKIVAQSGSTVYIWGYIKETSSNNGSTFKVENGATIQLPLVIYDYKGGSATYGIYQESTICPFKLFDFPNVHSMMDFYYGSTLNCQYKLYANDTAFIGTTVVIGKSGSFLNLEEEGSHVTFKYQPESFGYSSSFSSTDTTTTDIGIYGTMSLGYISVSLGVYIYITTIDIDIKTSSYELPISYRLSFTVHDGAILNIDYSVKLMPGSVTTIEKGGTVNLKNNASLIAYDNTYTEDYSSATMKYPKTGDSYYAKLVNNGTFIVNSGSAFGGMLYTESADAIFDILNGTTSVTSTWDSNTSGSGLSTSCTTASTTLAASGVIGPSDKDYASGNFGNESYTSASVTKSDGTTDYYWKGTRYYETITVSVTVPNVTAVNGKAYNFSISYTNNAGTSTSTSITGNTSSLSTAKTGSYFVKKGSTFTVSASRTSNKVTLKATPASGDAQSATASSSGGTATLNLSADQDWTITMSS